MGEFLEGRVNGIFAAGHNIESRLIVYEETASKCETMKEAFTIAGQSLRIQLEQSKKDLEQQKISIKESNVIEKTIKASMKLMVNQFNEAEAKRLAAQGAIDALKAVVVEIETLYRAEKKKAEDISEYEKVSKNELSKEVLRDRPVGVYPENLVDTLKTIERQTNEEPLNVKEKKIRKKQTNTKKATRKLATNSE